MAANSAGESAKVIYNKLNPKIVGIIVSAISAILAISGIMNYYINFLYLISSVFAPMAAVLLISYYCTKQENKTNNWYWNMFAWFAGFITYTLTGYIDSIVLGPTLLAIIVSGALTYLGILIKKQIKPGIVP